MTRLFAWIIAMLLAAAPAWAAYPLSVDDATRAVLAQHPELAGAKVELMASIETRTPAPALVAGSLEPWSVTADRVRIRCQQDGACLPFYVLVRPTGDATALHVSKERTASSVRPATQVSTAAVRAGQRTSMVIDSGRLHIRMPVTCLQSGAIGETVRVQGAARSTVLEAAVLDSATVRGTL